MCNTTCNKFSKTTLSTNATVNMWFIKRVESVPYISFNGKSIFCTTSLKWNNRAVYCLICIEDQLTVYLMKRKVMNNVSRQHIIFDQNSEIV